MHQCSLWRFLLYILRFGKGKNMRVPLIAGNWKMHKMVSEALALVEALLRDLPDMSDREALVCPPFTALHAVGGLVRDTPLGLGAQDVFYEAQGAYTGAISPLMLRDVGCTYAIVGHSERRQIFGEDDTLVNRKLRAALSHNLRPILCVGETKPQRDAGQAEAIVVSQVRAGLAEVDGGALTEVVVASEPVWALWKGDDGTQWVGLGKARQSRRRMRRLCMRRFAVR